MKKLINVSLFAIFITTSFVAQNVDYAKMDARALSAPEHLKGKPDELAKYLTATASNDFEKIRGIFRWVTNNIDYDVKGYLSGGDIYKSPEEAMKSGTAVCDGYSGVINLLAKSAGLEVVKVTGFSKGYGYRVGDKRGTSNHAWNAIRISGKWYLFDATWGAGAVENGDQYKRRFEEHYFLTAPEKFIYDHLPDDPKWQLLTPAFSDEEFLELPYYRPQFFTTGLESPDIEKNVTDAEERYRLVLSVPEDVLVTVTLFDKDMTDLSTFTFLQREGDKVFADLVFPSKGDYILRLYSKFRHEEGSYSWAADFGFDAHESVADFTGFPLRYEKFDLTSSLLYTPVNKELQSGKTYNFKIKIPGAKKAAVIVDGNFVFLEELPNERFLFSGDVKTGAKEIMVAANFGVGNRFEGLLGYSVR